MSGSSFVPYREIVGATTYGKAGRTAVNLNVGDEAKVYIVYNASKCVGCIKNGRADRPLVDRVRLVKGIFRTCSEVVVLSVLVSNSNDHDPEKGSGVSVVKKLSAVKSPLKTISAE